MTSHTNPEKENLAMREELKRAQIELSHIDEMKRNFIVLAASELRNPVAILLGYARILERQVADQARESAAVIAAQALHLKNVVDAIVTLQQYDAQELHLVIQSLLLAEIVESSIASFRDEINQKSLKIENRAGSEVYVLADRERLCLVMTSLLSNAIKFSPRGGTVTIASDVQPMRVVIGVGDQGIGIAAEEHRRIFERFYQVGDPLRRRHNGIGLGLAVAKMLVELHNGSLWVESVLNQGCTFHFSLPRAVPADSHDEAPP